MLFGGRCKTKDGRFVRNQLWIPKQSQKLASLFCCTQKDDCRRKPVLMQSSPLQDKCFGNCLKNEFWLNFIFRKPLYICVIKEIWHFIKSWGEKNKIAIIKSYKNIFFNCKNKRSNSLMLIKSPWSTESLEIKFNRKIFLKYLKFKKFVHLKYNSNNKQKNVTTPTVLFSCISPVTPVCALVFPPWRF